MAVVFLTAVVFLEEALSSIPMQMASTKLHRGPRRRVVLLADHGEFMTYENAIMDFTTLGLRSMWRGLQRRWEF